MLTPEQDTANLRFALELAIGCLNRVNATYGKGYEVIDSDDEDRTFAIDRYIEEWGIQGTINESRDALAGKPLEDYPDPAAEPHS